MGYKKGSGKPRKLYKAIVIYKDGTKQEYNNIRVKKVFNLAVLKPSSNICSVEWID